MAFFPIVAIKSSKSLAGSVKCSAHRQGSLPYYKHFLNQCTELSNVDLFCLIKDLYIPAIYTLHAEYMFVCGAASSNTANLVQLEAQVRDLDLLLALDVVHDQLQDHVLLLRGDGLRSGMGQGGDGEQGKGEKE